jgi:hypothetical protein
VVTDPPEACTAAGDTGSVGVASDRRRAVVAIVLAEPLRAPMIPGADSEVRPTAMPECATLPPTVPGSGVFAGEELIGRPSDESVR